MIVDRIHFSIVIPVYNVAPYLRECLGSVLAQSYNSWEAICVNDGSTDGSGAILDEYAAKDSRFKVIHQENHGVSAARNAALEVAQGEWLLFLDGDDILREETLSVVLNEIQSDGRLGIVRFQNFRFECVSDIPEFDLGAVERVDVSRVLDSLEMDGVALQASRNAIARTVCKDVKFEDFVCGEDRLFTFQCLQRINKVSRVSCACYGYRRRPLSYTTSVIKTYRGWVGELAYRLAFLSIAAKSTKRIDYTGSDWWLGDYLFRRHMPGFMNSVDLTMAEKVRLFLQWRSALPRLCRAPGFSLWQRFVFLFQYCICHYRVYLLYHRVRYEVLGPDFCLRKAYRRVRRHGEFAVTE